MPTFQECLNSQYPTKEAKEKVKEIIIDWGGLKITDQGGKSHTLTEKKVKELDGKELNLSEYPNLEKVIIYGSCLKNKLTSLDVSNCSKLIELNCSDNQLTNLDLTNCLNLEELNCSWNQITNLNIQGCSKLEKLNYNNNPIVINEGLIYWWQKTIHPDFTKELIKEWEKKDFDYWKIKQWIQKGLKPSEANLASYCRYRNLDPENENWNLNQSKEEFLWTNWQDWREIHEDFWESDHPSSYPYKTYQQRWEKEGLTYQEASEWIQAGWKPEEFATVAYWKSQNYTPETAKGKSHAQHWLEQNYPSEGVCQRKDDYGKKREEITKLETISKSLTNSLLITDWPQLEWIDCRDNQLTNLTITNCPNLERIDCYRNQLTNLELNNLPVLTTLKCHRNQLTNLNFLTNYWESLIDLDIRENKLTGDCTPFSQLVNCESLWLSNNSFTSSLAPLQSCKKLRDLDIRNNTQINSGLEYLPESLEEFRCRGTKLATELEVYGEPKYDDHDNYLNLIQNWKYYPKWQARGFSEQEFKQWIMVGLSYREYKKASYLKEQKITSNQFQKELKSFKGDYQLWKADYLLKQQLTEEQAKIPTFEKEILRLTNLIKSHKEKIIEAYTHFFAEKELLKELITAHLEYRKSPKEQKVKFRKQRDKIRDELEEKISEELMGEVEVILEDCEKLIHYEAELEAEIKQRRLSIEDAKKVIYYITNNHFSGTFTTNQGNMLLDNQLGDNTNLSQNTNNNTQVGNVNIENSNFAGTVAIGVGQIEGVNLSTQNTEQQAQIQLPPKSNQPN